jgi:hypothetical protein
MVLLWTWLWQVGTILVAPKEKRRSDGEVCFSRPHLMSEFESTKEQQPSSQITIVASDGMAAIAKFALESKHIHSF